ncbi:hypothetical protein OJ997_10845 [Solirubrobacter phytolaccae]|uniref:Uncharacterized protein n=1 Tax=Solirubrobacter phytolaccae TaxID=1404360 RepID=A0A9X3NB63_9ACTN|nr:hypothetical protein [Solirubrobacter phytolaccae]MDA0180791.1 hypothetical protein [Solirubrobacter phytolaccae]
MRRGASAAAILIAGSMLVAWVARLEIATRTDQLAPMSPLACLGFLAAGAGTWALPDRRRTAAVAGTLAAAAGVAGLLDTLIADGRTLNRALVDGDVAISTLTATALVLLGGATAVDGREWLLTRKLAMAAGAVGGAAAIGSLLGVPLFYGASRPVQMSWQAALCSLLVAPRSCGRTRPARSSSRASRAGSRAGRCRR